MEDVQIATIIRVGHSVALVIPKNFCAAFNIQRGDRVVLSAQSENVISFRLLTPEELLQLKPPVVKL